MPPFYQFIFGRGKCAETDIKFSIEFDDFIELKAALDSGEELIDGIGLDHYQYLNYKSIFPGDQYDAILHKSNDIAVGFMVANMKAESINLIKCLETQAIMRKCSIDKEILDSLNHEDEFVQFEQVSRTVGSFYGKEISFALLISGATLAALIIIYALIDYFILDRCCKDRAKSHPGNNNDKNSKNSREFIKPSENENIDELNLKMISVMNGAENM